MAKINLSNLQDLGNIPVSERLVRFTKFSEKTGAAGTYAQLEFNVDDDSEFKGRKATMNSSYSDNSRWVLKRNLLALGASETEVNNPDGIDPAELFPPLIGNVCIGVFVYNEYTNAAGKLVQGSKLGSIKATEEWS